MHAVMVIERSVATNCMHAFFKASRALALFYYTEIRSMTLSIAANKVYFVFPNLFR